MILRFWIIFKWKEELTEYSLIISHENGCLSSLYPFSSYDELSRGLLVFPGSSHKNRRILTVYNTLYFIYLAPLATIYLPKLISASNTI